MSVESLQAFVDQHIMGRPGVDDCGREKVLFLALVHGNLDVDAAAEFCDAGARCFGVTPAVDADGGGRAVTCSSWRPDERVICLRRGGLMLYSALAINPDELNSATEYYFQCEPDTASESSRGPGRELVNLPKRCATMDLLGRLFSEPAFDVLRTKEQLGYSVSAGVRRTCGVLGVCFVVVSSKKSPAGVIERIEAFLKTWRDKLVFEQPFEQFRESLIAAKQSKDTTLCAETARHWSVLAEGRTHFNRAKEEAEALEGIKIEDCLEVFDRMIAKGAPERALLVSCVYGSAHRKLLKKETVAAVAKAKKELGVDAVEFVEDLETWRQNSRGRACYPSTV